MSLSQAMPNWLPDVAAGKRLCAFAITEPQAGSDLAAVRTPVADFPSSSWAEDALNALASHLIVQNDDTPGVVGSGNYPSATSPNGTYYRSSSPNATGEVRALAMGDLMTAGTEPQELRRLPRNRDI